MDLTRSLCPQLLSATTAARFGSPYSSFCSILFCCMSESSWIPLNTDPTALGFPGIPRASPCTLAYLLPWRLGGWRPPTWLSHPSCTACHALLPRGKNTLPDCFGVTSVHTWQCLHKTNLSRIQGRRLFVCTLQDWPHRSKEENGRVINLFPGCFTAVHQLGLHFIVTPPRLGEATFSSCGLQRPTPSQRQAAGWVGDRTWPPLLLALMVA